MFDATTFQAAGRVNTGGRKIPLAVAIGNDRVMHITNADGFNVSVNSDGGVSNISCTLADGTIILCEGYVDRVNGSLSALRLDATDQENFSWFWVEVRRK
jgi:hypothetical protein